MNITIEIIFLSIILLCILILVSFKIFITRRGIADSKLAPVADLARSFLPIIVIIFLIRAFLVDLFQVPTGSMEPTILPGEHILAVRYPYGLRMPLTNHIIVPTTAPKRGDIVIFRFPLHHRINFIKRVIGLPGDHIKYQDKTLTINGETIKKRLLTTSHDDGEDGDDPVKIFQEDLANANHKIYLRPAVEQKVSFDFLVPRGYYFMLGDNRDGSGDSRFWGLVPQRDLIGKAILILLSRDKQAHKFRWNRIGTLLH